MKIDMVWVFLLAYLVGGFGSFGYVWNHTKGEDRCYVTNGVQHDCYTDDGNRTFLSLVAGAVWPIYWGGNMAINLTK